MNCNEYFYATYFSGAYGMQISFRRFIAQSQQEKWGWLRCPNQGWGEYQIYEYEYKYEYL